MEVKKLLQIEDVEHVARIALDQKYICLPTAQGQPNQLR